MHYRNTIPVLAVAMFFLSGIASAALAADPTEDPKCWPRSAQAQCSKLQGYFDAADLSAGGSSDCGQGFFQCFSGRKPIDIAIHIGETGQVKHLGEYIRVLYQWLIPVGAILAVVVIMVGGVVWLTSGGADRLSMAKQWIGNAIIGLALLLGAYVILSTINPDLVRLTLPRTQILRPIVVGAKFCADFGEGIEVHRESREGPIARPEEMRCGREFSPVGTSARTCLGSICPGRQVCIPGAGENGFACADGTIGGEVAGDGEAFLDNNIELVVVCSNGATETILSGDGQEITKRRRHKFALMGSQSALAEVESTCATQLIIPDGTIGTSDKVRGYFFKIEVNDDAFLGGGNDDWYAVGAKACGQSVPIRQGDETDPSGIRWQHVPASDLIPQAAIAAALRQQNPTPYTCNMALSRANFPDR